MSNQSMPLSRAEREDLVARLIAIRDRLDSAGEMLTAIHVSSALESLSEGEPAPQ